MRAKQQTFRIAVAGCLLLAALALSGCSLGYVSLRPGENSALYAGMFHDIINTYDEPYWLWIRGTISGDLNGNGVVDEEIVIATIQKGTPSNPGPIELAFLVACEVSPDGERRSLSRVLLFDSDPVPGAPKPINDLGMVTGQPLTRVRAQMIQDKLTLRESVVVYFWGDDMPGDVWYAGYSLRNNLLVKNMETAMRQAAPGFLSVNLDRRIDASRYGYQLVFGVASVPEDIFRKLVPANEAPLWGHVYARDADGAYQQADEHFGQHYRQIENSWNQVYLKAVLTGLPAEELAWFEYHMGLMNHYTSNPEMADRFLEKAEKGARDAALAEAIRRAKEYVAAARKTDEEAPH